MKQVTKIFDNFQALVDAIMSAGEEYKPTADMIVAKGEEIRAKEDGEKLMEMKWVGVEGDEDGKVNFIPITPDMVSVPTKVIDEINNYVKKADRLTRRRLERKFQKSKIK